MNKTILGIFLSLLFASTCFASDYLSQFDENCRFIYRNAYVDLSSDVDGFNQKILSKFEMSSRLAGISLKINSSKGSCEAFKADMNAKCIADYQDLYLTLRNKINIGAVLSGAQKEIDRGPFGSDRARELIRLKVIDLQCK